MQVFNVNGNEVLYRATLHGAPHRQVPIYDVHVIVVPGEVEDPEILFRIGYLAATDIVTPLLGNAQVEYGSVRMNIDMPDNHEFTTSNVRIGTVADVIQHFLEQWEYSLQSNEDQSLGGGRALNFTFQFHYHLRAPPPRVRERVAGKRPADSMWISRKLMDLYLHGKEVLRMPTTNDHLCFPMAFLASQCRGVLTKDYEVVGVLESQPVLHHETVSLDCHSMILCPVDFYQMHAPKLPQYFFQNHIVLFNPYKPMLNAKDEWLMDREKPSFVAIASKVHEYVETQLQKSVDYENLPEVAQVYADVFQVFIHIRRKELGGKRSEIFFPSTYTPQNEKHISIYVTSSEDDVYGHCDAITHTREFTQSKRDKRPGSILDYCDYCLRMTCHRGNKQSQLEHMKRCRYSFHIHKGLQKQQISYNNDQRDGFRFDKATGVYSCITCRAQIHDVERLNEHQCYSPAGDIKEPLDAQKIFVFDMEAQQNLWKEENDRKLSIHTVNLVCIRGVYNSYRSHFLTLDAFMDEILHNPIFAGSTILAHNGSGYDCQFIVQYLQKHNVEFQSLPRPGSLHKYLSLEIVGSVTPHTEKASRGRGGNKTIKADPIIFKDFMMFMSGSLRGIAKALKCKVQKGDFPHKMNTSQYQTYEGSFPDIDDPQDFFCTKYMKDKEELQELKEWCMEQQSLYCACLACCTCSKPKWNLQAQLLKYCWLDVDVLAECIEKFREEHLQLGCGDTESFAMGWQLNPIDPFAYLTQSQVALALFSKGHSRQPAVSPIKHRNGWSKVSIEWLEDEMEQDKVFIQHYGNSEKEYYIGILGLYVDGYCAQTNTVYQFHGCYFHGCKSCCEPRAVHPQKQILNEIVYNATLKQGRDIVAYGYSLVTMWECEWKKQKAELGIVISEYTQELTNIIMNREFLHGGRTEVFSPYAEIVEDQRIEYIDVCSLYPAVCSLDTLPIGHPIRFFGKAAQSKLALIQGCSSEIFGYVRCKVSCPSNDIIGLLPTKDPISHRLTFDVFEKTGTWFTAELYFALQRGYRVLEVYEILHFDASARSDSYFRGYMSAFFRMKQEAEGWVDGVTAESTPEAKEAMIETILNENPGMCRMRADKISKNPTKRQLGKIYINCLWGKFGQDSYREHKEQFHGYQGYFEYQTNPAVDLTSARYRHLGGEAWEIIYKDTYSYYTPNAHYNVYISAAVTAHARVRLHTQMFRIGPERILYCDTDSLFYLHDNLFPSVAGRGLGNWVNEIEKDYGEGVYITKFIGLSPKNYVYVLSDGSYHMKAKGVKLTIRNLLLCQPEVLEKLVHFKLVEKSQGAPESVPLILEHFSIYSNSTNSELPYGTVLSLETHKRMQMVLSKRQLVPFLDEQDTYIPDFCDTFPLSLFGVVHTLPLGACFDKNDFYRVTRARKL